MPTRTIVLLLLLPILVQLPALSGWLSADPIFRMSALSVGPVSQILPGFPGWIDGNAGVTTQALGHLAAEDWLHGIVPWWNPYAGLGMPLAAEMQNSALFLPFVLLLHFADGVLYLKIAMQILTGLFTLALLRELGLDRRACLVGAILTEFCGTLAWFSHGPIMPVPFLPLLLLGIERAARFSRERRPGGWGLVALAIAGSIAAGFPETAFMDGLLALCVAAWRVASAGPRRLDVATRIIGGGLVGLLLSAPAWLPFAESLPVSFLGQNGDFAGTHLLRASYGLLLLPYLLGTLLYGTDRFGASPELWWHTGGYLDLAMLFVGGVALLGRPGGLHTGLRRVLAAWLVLSLLKAAGMPGITQAFDLIPFVLQTMFYVYASPGWEIAAAVLAALAIDDLERGVGASARRLWMMAATCLALAALAIALAWPPIRELARHVRFYPVFPLVSAAWTLATVIALCLLLAPTRRWPCRDAAAALLVANALLLFVPPILSGTRHGTVDRGPIRALQAHQGLGRFYSLFVLQPNYGSLFRIASLNYNAVPVPLALTRRVARDLDPDMDMTGLFGGGLHGLGSDRPTPASPQITAAIAIERLEALGVSDLVMPRGLDPLEEEITVQAVPGPQRPVPLTGGATITGSFSPGLAGTASIKAIGIVIGTYRAHPSGPLGGSVCVAGRCVAAHGELAGAWDNHAVWLTLDQPIETRPGDRVSYRITPGTLVGSVALWTIPLADGSRAPFAELRIRSHEISPVLVYRDAAIDIVRLPNPAPYFATVSGRCDLQPASRQTLTSTCPAPDRLIRRELFFPGWSARIGGRPARLRDEDGLQSLALPAGRTDIRFSYAPPHVGWAWAAMLLGLVLLGLPLLGLPVFGLPVLGLPVLGRTASGPRAISRASKLAAFPAMLFCLYAGIAVTTIALLMPPFQAADELTHDQRADEIAGGGLIASRFDGRWTAGGTIDLGIGRAALLFEPLKMHPQRKTTRALSDRAAAIGWDRRGLVSFPNTAPYPPAFYLPAASGVLLARLADASVVHGLVLSRLLTGVTSAALGATAILLAGEMAPLLFTILCLPMSLALFAAVSQDGPMIASTALAVSLLTRAGRATGRAWRLPFGVGCAALCLVAMARPPYLPVALLPLLLSSVPRRDRLLGLSAILACGIGWTILADIHTVSALVSDHMAAQLHALARYPGIWHPVVVDTVLVQLQQGVPYFREFVGVLGWLDTKLPNPYYAATGLLILVAIAASLPSGPPLLTRNGRWVLAGLLVAATFAVFVLQYLTWTPIGGRIVEGVQGRYFLPLALFVPLLLPGIRFGPDAPWRRACQMLVWIYPTLSLAVAVRAIVLRYYL